ncbi:MAG: extracellular solute-binding protein [Pseudomonadota bacterium]|jgi:microcin C transport system substrate-binding protein|nr:extracellular solute-binding protein [Alphaproteobacteria bacterium]
MGDQFSHKIYKNLVSFLFCFLSCLYAKSTPYFSVYNTPPKYDINTKHFDHVNPNAPKKGALKLAVIGTFDGLNPFCIMGNSPMHIAVFCFARLLDESRDEIGVSYPYLAKSLKISSDKKTITYFLREEAAFSDGTPITAKDVVWSFNFLIKINPMMKQYYKDVSKIEAIDRHTVKFHSKNPKNKELPGILGQIYIYPSEFFQAHMTENGIITKPFPTSGPYKISAADLGRTLIFERIKNWWGEKIPTNVGLYNFDTIELQYFRDQNAAFQGFLTGNSNLWIEASANKWHTAYDISAIKDGKIIKKIVPDGNHQATKGFAFNLRREKFKDIRVRKAISLLFNFESLNKAMFYNEYYRLNSYYGNAELAHNGEPNREELEILLPYKERLPPEVFGPSFKNPVYREDFIPRETLQNVLQLLKEAGWELKDQKLTNSKGEIFEITFLYANTALEKIIFHMQRNLAVAGINLKPKQVDASTYTEMIDQFDFDITMIGIAQSHSLGNEQREFFGSKSAHVKGSKNLAGIENPIVDELIEKLIVAKDYQSMLDHTHAIDRILCWNYYIVMYWDFSGIRTAYWNEFAMPEESPKYTPFPILTWWTKDIDQNTPQEQSLFSKISQIIKGWFL